MWNNFKRTFLLVFIGLSQVCAQLEDLFPEPQPFWTAMLGSEVMKGNGVFLTPDGRHLVATTVSGTVSSYNARTGDSEWEYKPKAAGADFVRSHSGVAFTTENSMKQYMVYSIVENENSANSMTRVIALDMAGNELWVSGQMDGIPAGTPVISDDGEYVFLTHNAEFSTVGIFSTLWAAENGALFYSMTNETSPFAPPGIYHGPAEGYYDGEAGVDNTNDIIMWSVTPKPDDASVGPGATFAFQFPKNSSDPVGYFLLGDEPRAFQTTTPPTITNNGRSAYWSVSRSGYTAWTGEEGLDRWRFNRAPNANTGFTRNKDWPGTPCFAAPALSSDEEKPFVFGGSAHTEFVRLSFDFGEETTILVGSHIMAKAIVDPEDRAVYYAESSGLIHQADFNDISDIFTYDMGFPVEGEIALSPKGDLLYVATSQGDITALQLAELPIGTPSPSSMPSDMPSSYPTKEIVPTTPAPTKAPSLPTDEPVPTPTTPAPTEGGVPGTPAPSDGTEESGATQPMRLMALVVLAACMLV